MGDTDLPRKTPRRALLAKGGTEKKKKKKILIRKRFNRRRGVKKPGLGWGGYAKGGEATEKNRTNEEDSGESTWGGCKSAGGGSSILKKGEAGKIGEESSPTNTNLRKKQSRKKKGPVRSMGSGLRSKNRTRGRRKGEERLYAEKSR